MTTALVCPACHEIVLSDVRALCHWDFGYTWLGDRRKWTHNAHGLVHLCDPARPAANVIVRNLELRRVEYDAIVFDEQGRMEVLPGIDQIRQVRAYVQGETPPMPFPTVLRTCAEIRPMPYAIAPPPDATLEGTA